MYDDDRHCIFDVRTEAETSKALLCRINGRALWVPKSQVDYAHSEVCRRHDFGMLAVSKWWARKAGLLEYEEEKEYRARAAGADRAAGDATHLSPPCARTSS